MKENKIIYKKDEFLPIFTLIKDCIRFDHWTIEQNDNRKENQNFIENYNLDSTKIKEILTNIKITDFCYAIPHYKEPNVLLYVFAPSVALNSISDKKIRIVMYIKFRIYSKIKPTTLVVISFHKLNKKINYAFK